MSLLDHDKRPPGHRIDPLELPDSIGPLTAFTTVVVRAPGSEQGVEEMVAVEAVDPLADLDFQRALFILHQLHDRGVDGAAEDAEWHPGVVAWWHQLASRFEDGLLDAIEIPDVVLGPFIPLLGAIARRSRPVTSMPGSGAARGTATWDDPMHRAEVRRHPLAHARIAAAAAAARTAAPAHPPVPHGPMQLDAASAELLVACNLTSHLALHRRLLPALLGHLVWHELTSPADPFGGPTHATVADAYLTDHVEERPLAVWGAEITALVEDRLGDALGIDALDV